MQRILHAFESFLTFVGECGILLFETIRGFFSRPIEWRETLAQMAFVGVSSLPVVLLTTFFSGGVLCLYLARFLTTFHVTSFVGATIGLAGTREIVPVLAGTTVAARCGSAMAAQIGTMAVTEQIDALTMLSVPPVKYLVVPRLLASMLMVPALTLAGMYTCLIGAYLVAVQFGIAGGSFIGSVQQYTTWSDVTGGLIKAPIFGAIIAIVSCQQGLRTKNGAIGVGRATTNAVVISIVLVYIADFLLANVLF